MRRGPLRLRTPSPPWAARSVPLREGIREAVESIEGVTAVDTKMTMQPPWGPDKMSEFAKSALGFF